MPVIALRNDPRIVLTLDAGGSSFRFSAIRGGQAIFKLPPQPSHGDNLEKCLAGISAGFASILVACPEPPVAISFAFPGPADYRAGIIGDLPNLPAFRGGVALGPMLAEQFRLPVFVNNDGGLFAYGEAAAGFLPWINQQLAESGSPKRFGNLLGVTVGTGLGGGLVHGGELVIGDNASAAHLYLLRNKLEESMHAEYNVSIRGVRRAYAALARAPVEAQLDPEDIAKIARGDRPGDRPAAGMAYRHLGEVLGDAIAQALTVIDGLVVIGGGIAGAADLFLPATLAALNANYVAEGNEFRRVGPRAYSAEDPQQLRTFLEGGRQTVAIPGSGHPVTYDSTPRTAVGLSRLGTTSAIAYGAYAFALRELDHTA